MRAGAAPSIGQIIPVQGRFPVETLRAVYLDFAPSRVNSMKHG